MNREQMLYAKSIGKLPFKVIRNNKVKFTLGKSIEHVQSKFKDWSVLEIGWDEFESNYDFFSIMNTDKVLKDLSSVHCYVQKIAIGIADIYGHHEIVVGETEYTFKSISFGSLGGISTNVYPKSEFYFRRFSEVDCVSLFDLMIEPFKFKEFIESI